MRNLLVTTVVGHLEAHTPLEVEAVEQERPAGTLANWLRAAGLAVEVSVKTARLTITVVEMEGEAFARALPEHLRNMAVAEEVASTVTATLRQRTVEARPGVLRQV